MAFDIEMTGASDYQQTIKAAIAGHPGTGKTLLSSTAPQVFMVFFREQPRIMSIAERYIPHTKITNKYDDNGRLVTPVWETLHEVIDYMESERGQVYESFVVDTGDELQQAMKEGKKAQNRGKWAIQDWGWLADMYREVIGRIIDLPKHVIVTYHVKNTQEGDDGEIVRELALQGAAKDEAPGWFDIVGVIDSWEEDTESGKILHRGILTATTPKYPFAKDHSGKLPKLFEISDNFVGDFDRIHDLIYANVPTTEHAVIETIVAEPKKPVPVAKTSAETGVPTPKDVAAKKTEPKPKAAAKKPAAKKPAAKKPAAKKKEEEKKDAETADSATGTDAPSDGPEKPESGDGDVGVTETTPTETATDDQDQPTETATEAEGDVTPAEALDNIQAVMPEATVLSAMCEEEEDGVVCGVPLIKEQTDAAGDPIPDTDLMDLTMIRFRKHMCRDHFKKARNV